MERDILNKLREKVLDRGPIGNLPDRTLQESFILNTWGTNAIEGNILTLDEVTTVIEKGLTVPNRPVRDLLETIQHQSALSDVVNGTISDVDMQSALTLHKIIFSGILIDAGKWRTVNVRITGSKHIPPRVEKLLSLLRGWENDYTTMEMSREDVFSQAAKMHYGFEAIHPFSDGNGRVGRLLLNIHFLNHNWPLINILPQHRNEYLNTLENSISDDATALKHFLEVNMASSMIFLLDKVGSEEDMLLPLSEIRKTYGIDYSSKYIALRIAQGEIPGIRLKKEWKTSGAAIRLYRKAKKKR